MLESEIESKVCAYAKTKGLIPYKFTSPNRRSVPDRLFCGPNGIHFFIEFKRPGAKPTVKQWREINRLIALGHHVHVCDDIEEGKRIVQLETAFTTLPVSKEGDRIFAASRPGDDVAGHGSW